MVPPASRNCWSLSFVVSHVRRAVALATLFVVTTASFVPAGAAPRPQPTASPSSEVPLPGTLSLPLADPSTYKPFRRARP